MQRDVQPPGKGMSGAIELFDYPAAPAPPMPTWEAFPSVAPEMCSAEVVEDREAPPAAEAIRAAQAEEVRLSFEAGRERGIEDGRAAERQALADVARIREVRRMEEMARFVEQSNSERAGYFKTVEREVVQLALAVAARILRREVQTDPLLLSGAVRVALGQLSSSTEVRLRVPPADLGLWKDTIEHLPNLSVRPIVVAGAGMSVGECVLEAEVGSVNLGLGSQLDEIERALSDGTAVCGYSLTTLIAEEMAE